MTTLLVAMAATVLFSALGFVAVKDAIWSYKVFGGEFVVGYFILIVQLFAAALLFGTIAAGMVVRL